MPHRHSAHSLVNRMYAAKGYTTATAPSDLPNPHRVTFVATEQDVTVGTITVGADGPAGLLVEEAFGDHVQRLRDEGVALCEFSKFAIDSVARSKKLLSSLMHAALIYARDVQGCHKVLIEVNPRHARFYEAVLGFKVLVQERHNARVNAPAVLMALDLEFADRRVAEARARGREHARRSFYQGGFSHEEATGIANHLRRCSA